MRLRFTLALVVVFAGVTTVLTHHHKRPENVGELATALPRTALTRASRDERRPPLRTRRSPHTLKRVSRSGGHPNRLHDVTMYCATGSRNAAGRWPRLGDVAVLDRSIPFGTRVLIAGNAYTVEDWIGWGSEFDIYGGDDRDCESRALNFGRQRLPVVVQR